MNPQSNILLLVSRDESVCTAFREGIGTREAGLQIRVAATLEEARRMAGETGPALIVLDESACRASEEAASCRAPRFEAGVMLLEDLAPIVVLASPEHAGEIAPLLTAGAAEFIARDGNFLSCTLAVFDRRLQEQRENSPVAQSPPAVPGNGFEEDFAELLRHELNNPLTGILGNAELLLAEVRRRKDGRMPQGAQQRLETITDLAVRLRDTVRRLSQYWEQKHAHLRTSA